MSLFSKDLTNGCAVQRTEFFSHEERMREMRERIEWQKNADCLLVDYYRIGYRMAFSLPSRGWPKNMQKKILDGSYPWSTWYSWMLKERFETLKVAAVYFDDDRARAILKEEIGIFSKWEKYHDRFGGGGLCVGHMAFMLTNLLHRADRLGAKTAAFAKTAAERLLEESLLPWFRKAVLQNPVVKDSDLHNIVFIATAGGASLSRMVSHESESIFTKRFCQMLECWVNKRLDQECTATEGSAYDGFLLEAITQWLEYDTETLLCEGKLEKVFKKAFEAFLWVGCPGAAYVHAPIGDVETQMTFWTTVVARFFHRFGAKACAQLLFEVPPACMPTNCLEQLLFAKEKRSITDWSPKNEKMAELPSCIVLRTGFSYDDMQATVSFTYSKASHLHYDSGHVTIGRKGLFWITDPGYQQYVKGDQRDFTVGTYAHNTPIIQGVNQTRKAPKKPVFRRSDLCTCVSLNLTNHYGEKCGCKNIQRDVFLWEAYGGAVAIRDVLMVAKSEQEIDLSYAFVAAKGVHVRFEHGFAFLHSDQEALWIATNLTQLDGTNLYRHPGTTGPLTLSVTKTLDKMSFAVWWVFGTNHLIREQKPLIRFANDQVFIKEQNPFFKYEEVHC